MARILPETIDKTVVKGCSFRKQEENGLKFGSKVK